MIKESRVSDAPMFTRKKTLTLFENARVVGPDTVGRDSSVLVVNDRIVALGQAAREAFALHNPVEPDVEANRVDCGGAYLMPGFIDIHADYIEHMAAPRPSSIMNLNLSLRETERELVTHGITTMFHSLSFYKSTDFTPNPIRSPQNSRRLIDLISSSHRSQHLIRHRFHARFEIDNPERVEELENYIREEKIHLLSFMDHTPGQGQYRDLERYRLIIKGYRDVSDAEIDAMVAERQSRGKLSPAQLLHLARAAKERGIAVASHDDDSIEKLDLVSGLGCTISEFPITMEVAREARRRGMHTIAGAPNVLMGGSHSGNLGASEAILEGNVDILCSDYYPPAMLHAVFHLHREHGLGLADVVRLVSLNPAKAVGSDESFGSIETGKKADFCLVRVLDDGFPVVVSTYVDGVHVLGIQYRDGEGEKEAL